MIRSFWIWWSLKFASLLTSYQFPGDDIPVIRGSALQAMTRGSDASASLDDPAFKSIDELIACFGRLYS